MKVLLTICCTLLFFWVCQHSWSKFRSRRITSEVKKISINTVEYPSVSTCIRAPKMNKIFGKFTKEHDIPFGKFKHFVQENVFKRNETFYFVNQASSVDSGFPCMSTEESFDSGKPCSFPFFSKYLHHNCTQYDGDVYPWCWTRVDADRTFANNDPKFWGYCTSNCHGEQFDPSSNHNLANEGYDSFWVSDLYGLKTFCHTFNPKEKLGLDFDFRLGLYLGH